MSWFLHDGINFYYEDDDNGGFPFVFLHGLGGSTQQTLGLFKKTNGIRRISIDFRAQGKTIKYGNETKLSFNQFADDVLALIQYLNLDKIYIGGISTGAGVSLNFALRYPKYVKKLVLSRPAWLDRPQETEIQEAFKTVYEILNDDTVVNKKDSFKRSEIYKYMNEQAKYAGNTLVGQFDYPYAKETSKKLLAIPQDAPNYDYKSWMNIDIPILILVSKLDPIHPYSYGSIMKDRMKDAKLVEITPKEISSEQHDKDSFDEILTFLKS